MTEIPGLDRAAQPSVSDVPGTPDAPGSPPASAAPIRPDSDLRGLDIEAAITRGLTLTGPARTALFTEAAIAASWQAQELGVGPRPLAFLARCVRGMGVAAALDLPEPLIGRQPTQLARDWLAAASAAGSELAQIDLFAQWLETVAALLATRRSAADPTWAQGGNR